MDNFYTPGGDQRRGSRITLVLAACLLSFGIWFQAGSTSLGESADRENMPVSWQTDAKLTDVFFLNEKLGWAIGDQGVILRTVDGGKTWLTGDFRSPGSPDVPLAEKIKYLQPLHQADQLKPVRCRLDSVHFSDPQHGCIVGSYTLPYLERSRAVILATNDGGRSWTQATGIVIPQVSRIQFRGPRNGWALGQKSNLYPTGVFFTADGGHSWSGQGGGQSPHWIDGDRAGAKFVAIDQAGHPCVIGSDGYKAAEVGDRDAGPLSAVRMLNRDQGWAVGAGGTILETDDGGVSWKKPLLQAGELSLAEFDFQSLACVDNKIWLAGNPGSYVFSIDIETGQVSAGRTPITIPLTKVHFVNRNCGWAVGSLGTILATQDGGKTWQQQRGQQHRIALLAVAPDLQNLPLEVLSQYSGEEDFLSAAVVFQRDRWDPFGSDRFRQSTSRLGCSLAIELEAGRLVEQQLVEHLVRTIRSLRPAVIVSNCVYRPGRDTTTARELPALIRQAISAAADREAFSQQFTDLGLTTWQVDRLMEIDPAAGGDAIIIDSSRFLPRTGRLLEDQIAISRSLLELPLRAAGPVGYRVTHFSNATQMRGGNFFAGLAELGGELPRRGEKRHLSNWGALNAATKKHERFAELLRWDGNQNNSVWWQKLQALTLTADSVGGVWLMQLAGEYLRAGHSKLAAGTLELMASRYPNHPLTPTAIVWLAQYYASDEFARLDLPLGQPLGAASNRARQDEQIAQAANFQSLPQPREIDGTVQLVWSPQSDQNETTDASQADPLPDQPASTDQQSDEQRSDTQPYLAARWRRGSELISRLRARDPDLALGAQIRFIEAQILKKLDGLSVVENLYRTLMQPIETQYPVTAGGQIELNLAGRLPAARRPTFVKCIKAVERPRLDGNLQDDVWQLAMRDGGATLNRLAPPDGSEPRTDVALLAYDEQFLYAAFRCHKIAGHVYGQRPRPRPQDPQLEGLDRVEIRLDLDRDYRSVFQFVVDHRGWAAEHCSGCVGWNPDWFVEQAEDEQCWTVELAIPLEQLVLQTVEPHDVWAISVTRRSYDAANLWSDLSQPQPATSGQSNSPAGPPAWSAVNSIQAGILNGLIAQPGQFKLLQFQ